MLRASNPLHRGVPVGTVPGIPKEPIETTMGEDEVQYAGFDHLGEDAPPACPGCGLPMVLRTARRGRNAGGQFYGCSQYPRCKETLSLEDARELCRETTPRRTTSSRRGAGLARTQLPRRVSIAPSSLACHALLFEGIAAPRDAVATLAERGLADPFFRALCQWKLEVPVDPAAPDVPEQRTWMSVVQQLLERGRTIPLSPGLEASLAKLVRRAEPSSPEDWIEACMGVARLDRRSPARESGFESSEERDFYDIVVPSLGGDHLRGWMSRQVSLGGLTGYEDDNATRQRVDFLFAHPNGVQAVVEIDGAQHADQRDADIHRDGALEAAGLDTVRIPVQEIQEGRGPETDKFGQMIKQIAPSPHNSLSPLGRFLLLAKRAHQVQMSLLHGIAMGVLREDSDRSIRVYVELDEVLAGPHAGEFIKAVLDDFNELIADVGDIYNERGYVPVFRQAEEQEARIVLSFVSDRRDRTNPTLHIEDIYLPVTIASSVVGSQVACASEVSQEGVLRLFTRVFGFPSFREGQFEAIERCLVGADTIMLLPTGAGKSVAYQLASLLRPGMCIVIDPILSLIQDQMDNLRLAGIDRTTAITSEVPGAMRQEMLDLLARGEHLFCFVAPERFQDQDFRDRLRILTTHAAVSLITVDEAHCVSEWGHDFRPSYLNIARTSRDYCAWRGTPPPVIALTGTASRAVLKDVQRELNIPDFEAIITPSTFDRPELRFDAIPCRSAEKSVRLRGLVEAIPRKFGLTSATFFQPRDAKTMAGLVFCPWVNGDYGVVRVAEDLVRQLGFGVPFYSGKPPRGINEQQWRDRKRRTAMGFKRNAFSLMTCTKGFGMGIDKPNIRYTVHYALPPSIESFYQEAGRAGRDQRKAHCILLYSDDFPERTRRLLDPDTSTEKIRDEIEATERSAQDDIMRALYFHTNSFPGVASDTERLLALMDEIGDIESARSVSLPFDRDARRDKECAIHRLLTVGVVSDYTIDYRRKKFEVAITAITKEGILDRLYQHMAAYQRQQAQVAVDVLRDEIDREYEDFVLLVGERLIRFVYEVVERTRRRALSEMLRTCTESSHGSDIRKRILEYLEPSIFSEAIEAIFDTPEGGLAQVLEILEKVCSPIDAGHLRGESARALTAYPEHPGFLLLRGMSEAMTPKPDTQTVRENIRASVRFAHEKYDIEPSTVHDVIISAAGFIGDTRPHLGRTVIAGLLDRAKDKRTAARRVIGELPGKLWGPVIATLISEVNARLLALLER